MRLIRIDVEVGSHRANEVDVGLLKSALAREVKRQIGEAGFGLSCGTSLVYDSKEDPNA